MDCTTTKLSTRISNLNLNIQAWSKTATPQSTDKIYSTAHSYLQVSKLPAGVTKSVIKVTTDPANFHGKVATYHLKQYSMKKF